MPSFILLLHRNSQSMSDLSPEATAQLLKDFGTWTAKMRSEGRYVGSDRLTEAVKTVSAKGGQFAVTDGPYAESKEIVGGYYSITAKDFAEACEVAKGYPMLKHGGRVEVRQIFEMPG
jgi:hypothetical protein